MAGAGSGPSAQLPAARSAGHHLSPSVETGWRDVLRGTAGPVRAAPAALFLSQIGRLAKASAAIICANYAE